MINNKAEFHLDGDKVKLITKCFNCDREIDVIDSIFFGIPRILKFLTNKKEPIKNVEITLKCPVCNFKFCINRLAYHHKD